MLVLGIGGVAVGASAVDVIDNEPLRPADTSSPRDTLRSFLTDADRVASDWTRAEMTPASFRAHERAVQTLDLHTTPHGDSSSVRTLRVLLLKEILNRIEIPALEQIPGDEEVAEGSLDYWRIPDTPITIARIEEGVRRGEFLFSADTVSQLDRLYRQVRSLPVAPHATPGIYEEFLRSNRSWHVVAEEIRTRLRPVDTSSPLSTLEGFLDSMNRAYVLVTEADAALRSDPPSMTREQALVIEAKSVDLMQRAIGTLDLRAVPATLRADVGLETALELKEILDRIPLPPIESVPDGERVETFRRSAPGVPLSWTIPNTEIEILEITEGERAGEFLFSAGTVRRLPGYHAELRDLPYRKDDFTALAGQYLSPGRSEGFYERYVSTPGYMVTGVHFLGRFFEELPDPLRTLYGGQAAWKWIGLLVSVLALAIASAALYLLVRLLARPVPSPWSDWIAVLAPVAIAWLVVVVVDFVDNDLNMTGGMLAIVLSVGELIVLGLTAWAAFILMKALAETLIASPKISDQSFDASLIRIAARVIAFLVAAWVVINGVRNLGADVVPLLAGLGIGGLAVALAAQTTLANFLGSLILFANKPVRVGDLCRYGDQIGTVEQIGLHSTRIRSLERSLVTVPNADFSQMQIDNLSKRDQRLLQTTLQLRYETTSEQLRWILARLRELMLAHPRVTPEPARVRFVGYGAYSKDVEIFAYLRCRDQDVFLAIQEDLLLRIEDIVQAGGSGFAFPSQTSYLAQDRGVDPVRGEQAEAEVGRWRAEGQLPFPEFSAEERTRLEDILAYPPEGSPDHRPRDVSDPASGAPASQSRSRWFRSRKPRGEP